MQLQVAAVRTMPTASVAVAGQSCYHVLECWHVLLTWPLNLTFKQPHCMQETLIRRKHTLQDACQHRAAC
jgi:hypothetical protein